RVNTHTASGRCSCSSCGSGNISIRRNPNSVVESLEVTNLESREVDESYAQGLPIDRLKSFMIMQVCRISLGIGLRFGATPSVWLVWLEDATWSFFELQS